MSLESLSALTRGIHWAATSTSIMLAQQYMSMINQYFEQRGDNRLYARMAYIQLKEDQVIPIPLIALVAPKGLALDHMKVSLSVRIEDVEDKRATIDGDGSNADRLGFRVRISPRGEPGERRASDITDIEMEFRAGDPPDAIMRMIDTYSNFVDPKDISDKAARDAFEKFLSIYKPTPIKYTEEILKKTEAKPGEK